MRGTKDLLLRLFLSFALVVAAWPARAGAAPCVPAPAVVPKDVCAMSCCARRPMAGCVEEAASKPPLPLAPARGRGREIGSQETLMLRSVTALAAPCGCEIDRAHPGTLTAAKAILPAFDLLALPFAPLVVPGCRPVDAWAGVRGLDRGPPPKPLPREGASRAPPFVRA